MAKQNFQLKKNVFSNKKIKEQIPLNFEQLAKSNPSISLNRIKEIFDEIFYKIPIEGKESHKNIVEQEYSYLYSDHNSSLENKIKYLGDKVAAASTALDNETITSLNTTEHPLYEDGALLQQGANGSPLQDAIHIWIMQEGRKRRFESQSDPIFLEVKKALHLPGDNNDGRYYVSTEDLNNIPDGKPIVTTEDLNLKGNQIVPLNDLPDIEARHAYYKVELECLGSEVSDFSNQTINGDINTSQLQFYLGSDGCTIKYFKDEFSTDEIAMTIETLNINKGETVTLDILREGLGEEDSGLPIDRNYYYSSAGAYDIANVDYYGNDISDYIKNWGPFGEFEGILYAEGRIKIKKLPNSYLQSVLLLPQDESQTLLNGLPNTTTIGATESTITIINPGIGSSYTGQETSAYGTKMIYNGQNLWGSLNQSPLLQSQVFNNPNSQYYSITKNVDKGIGNTPVYGQPIIRYMNTYCVLMGGYYEALTRKLRFLDVKDGGYFTRRRSQVEDDLNWMMITSGGGGILGMRWDSESLKSRIEDQGYVGLKEYKINMYEGEGNIFNPETTGNNYSWPFI